MSSDHSYAGLLLVFLMITIASRQFGHLFLEMLMRLTRPGATVALMALLVYVYTRGLHYTFLMLAIVTVYLLHDVWGGWYRSDARRLFIDRSHDEDRFDPASSIDLQMADGSVTHAAPPSFDSRDLGGLLVFPPSSETLYEMNGA